MKKKNFLFSIIAFSTFFVLNFHSEVLAAKTYNYTNQSVTAYTGKADGHGSTLGYKNSQFNTVAVKKNSSNNPVIPFGTTIKLSSPAILPYAGGAKTKSAFTVTDTGSGPGQTANWIDIYYGVTNTTNQYWAKQFGNNKNVKINYSAYF